MAYYLICEGEPMLLRVRGIQTVVIIVICVRWGKGQPKDISSFGKIMENFAKNDHQFDKVLTNKQKTEWFKTPYEWRLRPPMHLNS